MSYNDSDPVAQKTGRIALLCLTIVVLGLFFFLFKVDACKSSPDNCREEFVEIQNNDVRGYGNNHKCSTGAIVEVVSSPPAPKPGIMCHCPVRSEVTPVPTK